MEGKKTMGYELVEQLGWEYPDAVFYPTGGGVGLIGMWKAFAELEELGWVQPGKRPKNDRGAIVWMRAGGPAFDAGANVSQMWQNAATFASGLRVPKPYGDSIMLEILRESEGVALAIPDAEDSGVAARLGKERRTLSLAGGRGGDGGLRPTAGIGISETERPRGAVQYRERD